MPEFILDYGSREAARAFKTLDSFTQGYVEAMFFTECEPGTDSDSWDHERHSSLPGDATFAELAPETLARIVADCAKFQAHNAVALEEYAAVTGRPDDHAGHDFWLTRNGHGAALAAEGQGAGGASAGPHGRGASDASRAIRSS